MAFLNANVLFAEVNEKDLLSFRFDGIPISEALNEVARTTGIKIAIPKELGTQLITKFYRRQTIASILKDMLRENNYAVVWSYGQKGIDSIIIKEFPSGTVQASRNPGSAVDSRNSGSGRVSP